MLLNNRYKINKTLENQGQSTKYHGEDIVTKGKVFIKGRTYHGMGLPIEKEIYQQVHHEQVPRLLDTFIESDTEYLVLSWIDGISAEAYFDKGETSDTAVIHIFLQICEVVEYLHRHPMGIIHRDINLSNMMISDYGRVYLIDFDISTCDRFIESSKEVAGTIGYTAPESMLCPEMSGKQSDVFSIGASLTAALKKSPKVYSMELMTIAKKAMAVIPSERYSGIEEVMKDLNLLL
jgi:serine/threonine-protein kinase